MRLQIAGEHRSALGVVSHDDATQTGLQVSQAGGQAKNRHHFRGHHDVKTILAGHAVGGAAQADHHLAQSAVVHVHHPLPDNATGVYLEGVAMVNMVVEHGRQQVVRQGNRSKVAREVKVDVFHGNDLRHAATGGAALHAKYRAQGRFAQAYQALLADLAQGVAQAHGGGGLALTCWRG